MALISLELTDSLGTWRTKINSLATYQGDLTSLITTDKSSLIAAINETETSINALGTISTQAYSNVNITGGTVSGLTSIGASGGSLTGLSTFTVATNILPTTDNSQDIGSSGAEFKNFYSDGIIYADTISLSTTAGEGFSSSIFPTVTDGTLNLGDSTYQWGNLYVTGTADIDTLTLSTTAGEGVGSHLIPTTNSSYRLGSTTRYYEHLYTEDVLLGTGTTGYGAEIYGTSNGSNYYDFGVIMGNAQTLMYTEGALDGNSQQTLLSSTGSIMNFTKGITQDITATATTGSISLSPFTKSIFSTTQGSGNITYSLDYTSQRISGRDYKCPSFTLIIIPNSSYSVTWFTGTSSGAIKWAAGSAPTLTTGNKYLIQFFSPDNGVTWIGSIPVIYT